MIRILYLYTKKDSASYIFYKNSLSKSKHFKIKFNNKLPKNFNSYDYIFLQSNFSKIKNINFLKNKNNLILVEPRYGHSNNLDFKFYLIIFNGIESKIFFSTKVKFKKSLIYPPYPEYKIKNSTKSKINRNLTITYHGNKVHIENSKKKIFDSILKLSNNLNIKIIVYLIYNIHRLGKVKFLPKNSNIKIEHVQYSNKNIEKKLSITDIGLVPQTLLNDKFLNVLSNDDSENFNLKFKHPTNIGRHLVFAQFNVPVVTEPTPSVIKYFDDESLNYLVYTSDTWYEILKKITINKKIREKLALKNYNLWFKNFRHKILNDKLIKLLKK